MNEPITPLEADETILRAAAIAGYSLVTRRPVVDVDAKQLPPSLFKKAPDYAAIRRLLLDGQAVAGAQLTVDVVYVLARPRTTQEDRERALLVCADRGRIMKAEPQDVVALLDFLDSDEGRGV